MSQAIHACHFLRILCRVDLRQNITWSPAYAERAPIIITQQQEVCIVGSNDVEIVSAVYRRLVSSESASASRRSNRSTDRSTDVPATAGGLIAPIYWHFIMPGDGIAITTRHRVTIH